MRLAGNDKVYTKAIIGDLELLANPETMEDTVTVNFGDVMSNTGYPISYRTNSSPRTVTLEIYFDDALGEGYTRKSISVLRKYLPKERKKGYQFAPPIPFMFSYGWFTKEVYMEALTINYTRLNSVGQPISATASVVLRLII